MSLLIIITRAEEDLTKSFSSQRGIWKKTTKKVLDLKEFFQSVLLKQQGFFYQNWQNFKLLCAWRAEQRQQMCLICSSKIELEMDFSLEKWISLQKQMTLFMKSEFWCKTDAKNYF